MQCKGCYPKCAPPWHVGPQTWRGGGTELVAWLVGDRGGGPCATPRTRLRAHVSLMEGGIVAFIFHGGRVPPRLPIPSRCRLRGGAEAPREGALGSQSPCEPTRHRSPSLVGHRSISLSVLVDCRPSSPPLAGFVLIVSRGSLDCQVVQSSWPRRLGPLSGRAFPPQRRCL